jgi:hypothetical protein
MAWPMMQAEFHRDLKLLLSSFYGLRYDATKRHLLHSSFIEADGRYTSNRASMNPIFFKVSTVDDHFLRGCKPISSQF